jgi:hypothetical protein
MNIYSSSFVGYQLKENQSVVDFLLEIVSEKASLRALGDRKGAVLSLEDLADLRRTMTSIGRNFPSTDASAGSETKNIDDEPGRNLGSVSRSMIPLEGVAFRPVARVLTTRRWLTAVRTVR